MAASKQKPIFWGMFAAGGTLTAFVTPVMIMVTGVLVPLGIMAPEVLSYDRMIGLTHNWIGKIVIFGILFLSAWHSAHRLRVTAHDFGIHADGFLSVVFYLAAAVLTVGAAVFLLAI